MQVVGPRVSAADRYKQTIMDIFAEYNLEGLAVGLLTFLIIGAFHPLVIKGEYYLGQKANWLFLVGGIIGMILSIVTEGVASIILGVVSFSCFWSILEVREQRERVRKGWFPANPRRREERSSEVENAAEE